MLSNTQERRGNAIKKMHFGFLGYEKWKANLFCDSLKKRSHVLSFKIKMHFGSSKTITSNDTLWQDEFFYILKLRICMSVKKACQM